MILAEQKVRLKKSHTPIIFVFFPGKFGKFWGVNFTFFTPRNHRQGEKNNGKKLRNRCDVRKRRWVTFSEVRQSRKSDSKISPSIY